MVFEWFGNVIIAWTHISFLSKLWYLCFLCPSHKQPHWFYLQNKLWAYHSAPLPLAHPSPCHLSAGLPWQLLWWLAAFFLALPTSPMQVKTIIVLVKVLHHLFITLEVKSKLLVSLNTWFTISSPLPLGSCPSGLLCFLNPSSFPPQSLCICLVDLPRMLFPQTFTWLLAPSQKMPSLPLDVQWSLAQSHPLSFTGYHFVFSFTTYYCLIGFLYWLEFIVPQPAQLDVSSDFIWFTAVSSIPRKVLAQNTYLLN